MSTLDRTATPLASFDELVSLKSAHHGRHVKPRRQRPRLAYALGYAMGIAAAVALGVGCYFATQAVLAPAHPQQQTSTPAGVLGA